LNDSSEDTQHRVPATSKILPIVTTFDEQSSEPVLDTNQHRCQIMRSHNGARPWMMRFFAFEKKIKIGS